MIADGPQRSRRFMSDINVVPLVDVVLVLLVIFMITAPLLYRGIDINLPKSSTNTIAPTERVVLTVNDEKSIMVDNKKVPLSNLQAVLQDMKNDSPEMTVYLRGDRDIAYGIVVQVMDVVKQVGIDNLGMVTEPLQNKKP
jgi:biopolymer transport protein TolR